MAPKRSRGFSKRLRAKAKVAKREAKMKEVWFQLKEMDSAHNVHVGTEAKVADLKTAIHSAFTQTLTRKGIDPGNLKIFSSKTAFDDGEQVLRGDHLCANIEGNSYDNPLHVHYDEPTGGGGAASSSGVQGAKETVEDVIKKRDYRMPDLPALDRLLLHREEAIKTMTQYIKDSVGNEGRSRPDNKFSLLGSSGMKGIGKTSMLLHGFHKAVPELAQNGTKVKASYLTFNGQGNAKGYFKDSLRQQGAHANQALAFGHVMLRLCRVSPELAHQLSFSESLQLYRQMLEIADEDTSLVLLVDKIGVLGDDTATDLLSELMAEMDSRNGMLVFVFTHISQAFLKKQETGSGRRVQPLELTALLLNTWEKAFEGEDKTKVVQAAKMFPGVHQLFLSCCGHPRAIFDGLEEAFKDKHLLGGHEADLIKATNTIIHNCKFADLDLNALAIRIADWFNFLETGKETELKRDGLLLTIEHEQQKLEFFMPLVMHSWAQQHKNSAMAHHLHQAYANDAVLGDDSEKKMEAVMYHYEAVLRLAVTDRTFALKDFYKSEHIDADLLGL